MNKNPRRALTFIALTLLTSGLLAYGFFTLIPFEGEGALLALGAVYIFVPAAMAIALQKFVYREPVLEPLRITANFNRWFLVAWLVPILLILAAMGLSLLPEDVSFSWDMDDLFRRYSGFMTPEQIAQARAQVALMPIHPFWIGLLFGIVAGGTFNAVVSLGEELGWRGFLLRQLEGYGFWPASLAIGVVWGLWHSPFVLHGMNYPEHPVAGVGLMTLTCILLSPPMVYVTLRARSVLAAAIFHGTINGLAGLSVAILAGGTELTAGLPGWPGFAVLGCLNLILFAVERRCPALRQLDGLPSSSG